MVFHLTKRYKTSLNIVYNTCDKSTVPEGGSGLVITLDVLGRLGSEDISGANSLIITLDVPGRLGSEDISGANSLISKILEPIHQQITFVILTD